MTRITTQGAWFEQGGDRLRLAGNHSWNGVQSISGATIAPRQITGNITTAWLFEAPRLNTTGSRYAQGAGKPLRIAPMAYEHRDGAYDLTRPNPRLYARLRRFVQQHARKGRIVNVILFEGTQPDFADSWSSHPFRRGRNHQGITLDRPQQVHAIGSHNRYQLAHARRVIRAVHGLPVILQIGNELGAHSIPWQRWLINQLQPLTRAPIGVSWAPGTPDDRWMLSTAADWYGPSFANGPIPSARRPQLLDTDHQLALRAPNLDTVTRYYRTGRAVLLMDGLDGAVLPNINPLKPVRDHITGLTR
jgi:hypothetical protein